MGGAKSEILVDLEGKYVAIPSSKLRAIVVSEGGGGENKSEVVDRHA